MCNRTLLTGQIYNLVENFEMIESVQDLQYYVLSVARQCTSERRD